MKRYVRVCVLVRCCAGAALAESALAGLDLTGWTLVDPYDRWTYSNPQNDVGRMDERGGSSSVGPGWVVSDFTLPGTTKFSLTLEIQGSGDDDIVGFAFCYQDNDNFYLVDWKRATQTFNWGDDTEIQDDTAEKGLKLKRIQGGWTRDGLWGGKDGIGVSELAGPTGDGWDFNTEYNFAVTLEPGRIVVRLDDQDLFDVSDSTFSGGAITFYGLSQDDLVYSNIEAERTTRGDMNCDGSVDFNDIDPFVVALTGRDNYAEQYPDCVYENGDVDCNGSVDFDDIDAFVDCVINEGCGDCP
jgi:hypothetical protein